MADGKAVNSGTRTANADSPQRRARDAALSGVLDPTGLLPDLIRLIRSYDLRAYHWQAVGGPPAGVLSISDGRSVTVSRARAGTSPGAVTVVSTTAIADSDLSAPATKWRVLIPAQVHCFVGLVDVRTLARSIDRRQELFLTGFMGDRATVTLIVLAEDEQ
jgi:hypothetical protein